MAKRRYIKKFSVTAKAPYLGLPAGIIQCRKVADLPHDIKAVWLTRKSTGIEQLTAHKSIRRIQSPLREDWLPVLATIPGLQYVQFSLPKSPDIPSLACLTGLRTLVLRCNRHQTSLEFLRGMDWIHSLCISEATGVTSLEPLSTLLELRELYIDGTLRGRNTVDSLSPLSLLQHLRYAVLLVRLAKQNRTLAPLRELKKIEFLYLSDHYSPEEYRSLLESLPRLREIRFNAGKRWPAITHKKLQ